MISFAFSQVSVLLYDRNDGDLPDSIPSEFYVGDENFVLIVPGPAANDQRIDTITWTGVLTAPSGQVVNADFGMGPYCRLTLGLLGTVKLKAYITYADTSAGPGAPANDVFATITVTPPTGVTFNAARSPGPNVAYNLFAGDTFYFHIIGGSYNNGYSMMVEEKITFTVPAGTAPPFGGGWGWNIGDPFNIQNAPGITNDNEGWIYDLKSYNNASPGVPFGAILMQYTQTIGVRVGNLDNTISDITLGTFTVTHRKVNETQYKTTIEAQ